VRCKLKIKKRKPVSDGSNPLRAYLFASLALADDCGTQAIAEVVGQFVELGVAVNLDGFLGGIADHVAVVAPSQVVFQFGLGPVVDDAVQVVG
jgi:hypothetical protein